MVPCLHSTISHTNTYHSYRSYSCNFVFKHILSQALRLQHSKLQICLLFYVDVKFPHYQTSGTRIPEFNTSHKANLCPLFRSQNFRPCGFIKSAEMSRFLTISYFLKLLCISVWWKCNHCFLKQYTVIILYQYQSQKHMSSAIDLQKDSENYGS